MTHLDLSHDKLDLVLSTEPGLTLHRWGSTGQPSWAEPSSPLFTIVTNGRRFDAHDPSAAVQGIALEERDGGGRHAAITLAYTGYDLEADLHLVTHPDTSLIEQWVTIRNPGNQSVRVDRVDSVSLLLPSRHYRLQSFRSAWGAEFEPVSQQLDDPVYLESRSGRSSNGMFPFFALIQGDEILSGSVAWSGNWVVRFEPSGVGILLSGGLHDWEFFADIPPASEFESPRVVLAGARGDLNEISRQYHLVGRKFWYPSNEVSRRLPLEWNHWWSYEDSRINEESFRANVEVAADLGLELCTLDAGWFGTSDAESRWEAERGDWDRVNQARFPSGIRSLAGYTHDRGLLFGLWCEIEGLGTNARLAEQHPEFAATRNGEPLGYVCFGCPDAEEWALHTLERLVREYSCDWIKLDFNLDPGAGCNRTDHGHGAGDGLYRHYRGYYRTLDWVRERYPEVVLENCSSGGLRIDLEIMRHTHLTFLSDPDWPEHNLQVFWGASTILAPEACLQWSWSQSVPRDSQSGFDPRDPDLTAGRLDYYIRTALLSAAGFSLRLPDLPSWVRERLRDHVRLYRRDMARFVNRADLFRLTGQPTRDGGGDRWCAFQYSLPAEHLVFVFRLPGAGPRRSLRLRGLDPEARYYLRSIEGGRMEQRSGRGLMEEGLTIDRLPELGSDVILIEQENAIT